MSGEGAPPPSPLLAEETAEQRARRRRAAKLANERLKLAATAFNGAAVAVIVAGLIIPMLADGVAVRRWLVVVALAFMLHILAHVVLALWKAED